MPTHEQATPCPLPWAGPRLSIQHSYQHHPGLRLYPSSTQSVEAIGSYQQSQIDDDTANIDFTTEVRARIRAVAPRRPPRRKANAFEPTLDICVDNVELGAGAVPFTAAPRTLVTVAAHRRSSVLPATTTSEQGVDPACRSSVLIAQPAYRLPPNSIAGIRAPGRRRISAILAERVLNEEQAPMPPPSNEIQAEMARPERVSRRLTIFIPSDDTTIMTIHPGGNRGWQAEETTSFGGVSLSHGHPLGPTLEGQSQQQQQQQVQRRAPRPSLAAAPRRAMPLQRSSRALQSTTCYKNVAGQGGGKENVPPGWERMGQEKQTKSFNKDSESKNAISMQDKPYKTGRPTNAAVSIKHFGKAPVGRRPDNPIGPVNHKRTRSDTTARKDRPKILRARGHDSEAGSPARMATSAVALDKQNRAHSMPKQGTPSFSPVKTTIPAIIVSLPRTELHYPLLEDDICQPQMYEDDWLGQQEKSIMHLINALFEAADSTSRETSSSYQDLRSRLLGLYQADPFPVLHKRIQASLLYGALSIPKELLRHSSRLQDDVGLRKSFLSLWLESYQPTALRAAAEVVVGRMIPAARAQSTNDADDAHARRESRSLSFFLETFLIRNDDAVRVQHGVGSIASIARTTGPSSSLDSQAGWSLRRTLLRSLMLILLLDTAKQQSFITTPLFMPSSPHKSSVSVLQCLALLLQPTLGEIARPLSHISYTVTHEQAPLSEYNYSITNLATDLRDGVRLTRLVELLLYPPPTLLRPSSPHESDITLALPTGEFLTSPTSHQALSRHLRVPCRSRASKLYNSQIALSALPEAMTGAIQAEDIVNGHRERTIALLWCLVSTWGLTSLIAADQLEAEIKHLAPSLPSTSPTDATSSVTAASSDRSAHLLQQWATVIGATKNITVSNLSTAFADQRVFTAIIDSYITYFPPTLSSSTTICSTDYKTPEHKLIYIVGCSKHLASLFTTQTHNAPTRETTLPLLALLASRVLPTARLARAATRIQTVYRGRLARAKEKRIAVLATLARDCAMVVLTRERIVGAAVRIQRGWRRWLSSHGRVC